MSRHIELRLAASIGCDALSGTSFDRFIVLQQIKEAIGELTRLRASNVELRKLPFTDGWLIWSNEHRAWWGPDCCGYPNNIAAAGRYTLAQALDICTQRSWMRGQVPPETMIPESAIPQVIAKAAPGFHDDKQEERADRHVTTQPGDLDTFSRPLRPGK